jgi:hypothetical protein
MCLAQTDDWSHAEVIWPKLYLIVPPPISTKIMLLVPYKTYCSKILLPPWASEEEGNKYPAN